MEGGENMIKSLINRTYDNVVSATKISAFTANPICRGANSTVERINRGAKTNHTFNKVWNGLLN